MHPYTGNAMGEECGLTCNTSIILPYYWNHVATTTNIGTAVTASGLYRNASLINNIVDSSEEILYFSKNPTNKAMMKKYLYIILSAVAIIMFASCSPDEPPAHKPLTSPQERMLNFGFSESLTGGTLFKWIFSWNDAQNRYTFAVNKHTDGNRLVITAGQDNTAPFTFSTSYPAPPITLGGDLIFSAEVSTGNITSGEGAGLFLTAYDADSNVLASGTSYGEFSLKGTSSWTRISVSVEIPPDTETLSFGGTTGLNGTASFRNLELYMKDPNAVEPTAEQLAWLKQYVHPLRTCIEDGGDDSDLETIGELIGDATMVGLGEDTHGATEFFQMKHRIVKYLAEKRGFDIFSIEANMPEAYRLNEYTLDGQGDPVELIGGMHFWTWHTHEVLDMVNWMREFNSGHEHKLQFTGFDMQDWTLSHSELKRALEPYTEFADLMLELTDRLLNAESHYPSQQDYILQVAEPLSALIADSPYFEEEQRQWLLQYIRIIVQAMDTSYEGRDRYMAENLLWIKERNPGSKIAAWAHNAHIHHIEEGMGQHLKEALGDDYVTIGFAFHSGKYTAAGPDGLSAYDAITAYPGTYEYIFSKMDEPIYIFDLRSAAADDSEAGKWLHNKLKLRQIGAVPLDEYQFWPTELPEKFDFLIFVRNISPSRLLPLDKLAGSD